jgi:hypothetical protein
MVNDFIDIESKFVLLLASISEGDPTQFVIRTNQ